MKPVEISLKYQGKIEVMPKVPISSYDDFSVIYTPGVAEVVKEISKDKDKSFQLTSRWNNVAIITDGTRVLGLGNVGPEASLPVMEGKALLFKYLGGVDAIPLPLAVRDPDTIINVVSALEPSFGGINLEDVESPKCFYILEKLQERMNIPVWHDDQQGTAGAVLAALINAMKVAGKGLDSKIVIFGAGAANIATVRLLKAYGFDPKRMIVVDREGVLHAERRDLDAMMFSHKWKYEIAVTTNGFNITTLDEAFKGADILIAASMPGPNTIPKRWISLMKDPIVFALANPVPEIYPSDAIDAGAKVVATGRSDFPNQVNNSLIFPGVFRGVLDSRSSKVDDAMVIAGAEALARFAERKGISPTYIIPRMDEWDAYYELASAVAEKAVERGYARVRLSREEFRLMAKTKIEQTRNKIRAIQNVD
ncbi:MULTISPECIES: NAD(P)-dependent malic enzyme [Metallosphaera]|uniref:Malate dehydrogenase (Oxaloacetate-decarboxylating) (NADP(+)) n=3 Tax=Metallosphaera TaxID=41980 RepID=A4YFL7_METS5|nr:Malate dehydrogenase (oxaloacetate-decarboxylating) (NADP(+)) [Metallosphaera sedula DSM 5348]AIM27205.1 Malate dehydrogenase (oxaloacetate-decarboxylating) (NADP(+)) [Metallosphaera sedula]AKV74101.1 malate dehydrogenase [Metallosphaera sedula]AKV76341.1 malate dehydrogenase [Metallosphaera sedula]AKV78592.1 malate dehydrogenase [Metallosphaera sedula]